MNLRRTTPAKRLQLYADASLMDRLARYAAGIGASQNKVLTRALSEFLERA